ncbi:molybdopterin binding oxidoreductase [Phellopilus nigrolimitatus]|nr:molybdopterin binding oxidoreductase [Phellopilus nigrolimitatus]
MGAIDMNFSFEVPHSEGLIVRGAQPFNAEPPASALVEFRYTPEELIYCRNHSPVIELDESAYIIKVDGLVKKTLELKLEDLKESFNQAEIVAALQCAGNRRKEMAEIKPVKGITWDNGVIANCRWSGVRLRDVLLRAGVDETMQDGHVWFASHVSVCQDDPYYGGSIPLRKALDPEGDVLLALDMNAQPLSPDHGYPLRVIVPGYTGARWVKWIDRITVARDESPSFYQQRDYKVLPPDCTTPAQAAPLWDKVPSIEDITCELDHRKCRIHSRQADRGVQVSVQLNEGEGERQWTDANITYQEGKWSWTLWECVLDVHEGIADAERIGGTRELVILCRACDESGQGQREACAWNMRGVAFNSYGKAIWHW